MGFLKGLGKAAGEFMNQDIDETLSYHTKQQVLIQHWVLGFIENAVRFVVFVYVMFYVLWYDKGYLDSEAATGSTSTMVSGNAVATSFVGTPVTRYFEASELTYPYLENGYVFISTKISSVDQKRGVCEDESRSCATDADCSQDVGAVCSENKFCVEPSWCNDKSSAVSFKPETDMLKIWVRSTMYFLQLERLRAKRFFYSNKQDEPVMFPAPGSNTFTVRDLLLLCEPPVRYEEVAELGAAIEVQVIWKCYVDSPFGCQPAIRARRVDSLFDYDGTGFEYAHVHRTGPDERVKETRSGIRLYVKTVGLGYMFSFPITIFKMSTGGSLLVFAPIIADLAMLHFFKYSKRYRARKFIITPDFDFIYDLQEFEPEEGDEDDDIVHETENEEWLRQREDEDGDRDWWAR